MLGYTACLLAVLMLLGLAVVEADAADVFTPTQADLDRVAAMLPETPGRLGPRITDRKVWGSVSRRPELRAAFQRAEAVLEAPLPELTDELYLDYSRTGNRRRCEAVIGERRGRVPALVLAECAEGKGRFLHTLEETLRAICREKSWVLPAHDGNLQVFEGRLITIDLASSALGWTLGMTDYLLGDQLTPEVRTLVANELKKRIFDPYRRMCSGEQSQYWLLYKMNWNSVCLANVTGAALTAIPDRRERAWYVLAADHYSRNALEGFTPDGYCDEGVSYWNYGFGHYAALAETVRRATGGGVDLMSREGAMMPSAYGFSIEIVPGICPAFADCPVGAAPGPGLTDYLSRRFTGRGTSRSPAPISGGLCDQVLALFPEKAPVIRGPKPWPRPDPLRTWYPDNSVYIGRPGRTAPHVLSVAVQGAHNAQNHNHNDVGVFMAVVGNVAVLPDIGAEVYTRRTFSAQRYVSKALNSWGHAVPVIAGKLQRTGRNAEAKVIATEFTPGRDSISMDIRSAYAVPSLQRLQRDFTYDRAGSGKLTVTDTFEFAEAATFETALLTFGAWERVDDRTITVRDGAEAVRVSLEVPRGTVLEVSAEPVDEDLTARRKATRIGLKLREGLTSGTFKMTIEPEPAFASPRVYGEGGPIPSPRLRGEGSSHRPLAPLAGRGLG